MGSWGATDADEAKPKFLTTEEKKGVYATAGGWVSQAGQASSGNDNASAQPEVLVALRGLATKLGQATVDAVEIVTTSMDASAGGVLRVDVHYNEQVTVATASPMVVVTNSKAGGGSASNFTLTMDGALPQTNDTLSFSVTVAGGGAVAADDVLSVGAQTINLNGGTIVDAVGGGNAERAISGAQGTAAGTITVVA